MTDKARRSSNLELLRILCMLAIVSDHLVGQSGIGLTDTLPHAAMYAAMGSGSRIACNVFIVISAWFLCVQPFRARRLVSLWLGLWLYTVPLTVLCRFLPGCEVGLGTLRWAMFPISTAQLWFLSAYFALMLCAPLLNTVLHHAPPAALTAFLTATGVLMAGYSTLFGEDGALSSSLFAFVWLYLFTGYLRLHPGYRADALLCRRGVQLALGLGIPAALTAARTLALWQGAPERVGRYLEYWRTALGAAPNLLAALGLVWLFKSLPLGCRRGINALSGAALGVYILHQTPAFRDFLWNGVFHAAQHPGSFGYAVFVVLAVYLGGAVIDSVRDRLVMRPLLASRPVTALCRRLDGYVNEKIPACD